MTSLELESFFYDKCPGSYKSITKTVYVLVPLLVCIITYCILRNKFKGNEYIIDTPARLKKFLGYHSMAMILAGILALFIIYLIFPGYTKPKNINTYPVVKNSIREDKVFDVLISNLDGGRAIFMPAYIDEELKKTKGKDIIVFEKYKYFVDNLDKKEFLLTTFDHNEVIEKGEDNNLFEILENDE